MAVDRRKSLTTLKTNLKVALERKRTSLNKKKKQVMREVNRKSKKYISDRFLMFHLLQNLMFYLVLFIVPTVSVGGCQEGISPASYIALGSFMLIVMLIDVTNLRQHIIKEKMKLDLKNFYGSNK